MVDYVMKCANCTGKIQPEFNQLTPKPVLPAGLNVPLNLETTTAPQNPSERGGPKVSR